MTWLFASRPRLSRVLLAMGTLLSSATGCEMETAGLQDTPDEGATGRVASAVVSTYYDFVANAPGAVWSTNSGGVPYSTYDIDLGACRNISAALENGVTSNFLFTVPKGVTDGFMRAAYTVKIPAASAHPTITATFGFTQYMNGNLTFSMKTQVNGAWVTLFSQNKTLTGALVTKTADLSAYAGQTLTIFLRVDANGAPTSDYGAWTDARIVVDGSPGPIEDGCDIGGVQYANGAVNPSISCQVCNPLENALGWSIRPDSCRIGGTCYDADELDSLGCKRCDPLTSQTAWTNKMSCEKLVVATTTTARNGAFYGYGAADDACENGGAPLGLPGTWKAILYDWDHPLPDTVPSYFATRPVVNLNGQQLFSSWNTIFTNQVWPSGVSVYAFGTSSSSPVGSAYTGTVWTGTDASGDPLGGNCNDGTGNGPWQATSWMNTGIDPYYASVGDFSQRKLINSGSQQACSGQRRFACVLIPTPGQITIENYDGTALGTIQGQPHNDAYAWRSVPYAAAPTGSRRLAPPAKATAWTGVRNVFNQPPPCPQPPLLPAGGVIPPMIGSEDCLYLNIWAPKTANPSSALPVLVYQFGGGHIFGGTASADDWLAQGFLDGDRLAASQNAVVVTIQTRTGALGWLTDPALAANSTSRTSTVGGGTSGNYGLLDALQSLKWVKRNISKFGGDPSKVTFFGESSGGTIVCDLMASPLSKDPADNKPYFSSIIIESGFCENPLASFRHTQATPIITSIGCNSASDKVACLRAASVQSFVNTEGAVLQFFPDMFGQSLPPQLAYGLKFGPHVDGYVLPTHPRQMFAAGTHNKVPTIVGTNKDEATFFMLFMVGGILTGDLPNLIVLPTCTDYVSKTNINLGSTLATSARALYPCNASDGLGPTKAYASAITHVQYECPARRTARALDLGQTQNVYRYWFTHRGDNLGIFHNVLGLVRDVGASHTFEIPFIFNTHNTMLWYWPSSRERTLTTRMQTYWRTFANSGNPNYTGGVTWPAYDRTVDNTLQLEVSGVNGGIKVVNNPNGSKCDFWDDNFNLDGWQ